MVERLPGKLEALTSTPHAAKNKKKKKKEGIGSKSKILCQYYISKQD
jgi:hypothetical protein